MTHKIPIEDIIKQKLREEERSISWLVKKINLYKIEKN
jgi:hypothetical protein